jgi:hypothetical protein
MEFEILNSQEFAALPLVRWNFEELKKYAIEKADEYKGIAYTESDAAAMKSDRADINRFIKAIEAERIKKKKEYLEPYNVFEAQVKEVLQPLKEAEAVIAKGLKEIDDKWREERREKIRAIYDANVGELADIILFDEVDIPDNYKKSASLKAIEECMKNLFKGVKEDLTEIEVLPEKYQAAALRAYRASKQNLSFALAEVRRIQQDEAALEERKRKAAEQEAKVKAVTDAVYKEMANVESEAEPELQLVFRVFGTREQILALRDFMVATNMRFERAGA